MDVFSVWMLTPVGVLWVYDHSVPLLTLRGNAPLLLRAGVVFIGYDGGQVVALKLEDGVLMWEQTLVTVEGRTELDRLSDIDGQLVFVASDLLVSSYKNRLGVTGRRFRPSALVQGYFFGNRCVRGPRQPGHQRQGR